MKQGNSRSASALDGIRVIDLSRILAGPLVGQMLADLGADVVKIERPGKGDDSREMGPPFLADRDGNPTSDAGFFVSCNRNKRSLTLDIQSREGRRIIRELVETADVLIENFKVGTLARYGLDQESLRKINPRLVYCSITGFGQTGPYAPKPGYDGVFQAMGGLMSVSGHAPGTPGEGPMKVGISMVDILTSYNAVIAIAAALYHRDTAGGLGQYIDMSLLDCGIAALSHFAQNYLITGDVPERRGNGGYGGIPSQAFMCSDRMIFVVVGNTEQYRRFCDVIERPDLFDDPRFRTGPLRITNRKEIVAILEAVFAQRSAAEWVSALDAAGVPVSFVNDMHGVFADPHVQSRGMVVEAEHTLAGPIEMLRNPLRLSETPIARYDPPPLLGEHSEAVLAEWLGMDGAAIADLRARSVI
jgi:crotonobetainyl-CoA:carnitine CoA-transferase CaiB-like acyl-CoA transferase